MHGPAWAVPPAKTSEPRCTRRARSTSPAKPVAGTVAHQYLRARKLGRIPEDWRCHPGLACIEAGDHKEFPALIVPLRDRANRIISIQRIWLDPKTLQRPLNPETGKKIKKKTWGPPFDASARVGVISGETLGLAEGPEKALAVKQLFSLPCWASCGAGRLQVAAQWIPPGIKKLIIFADFNSLDERKTLTRTDADGVVTEWPNPNFGTRTGMRAAFSAAELYEHKGYVVTIEPPRRAAPVIGRKFSEGTASRKSWPGETEPAGDKLTTPSMAGPASAHRSGKTAPRHGCRG